jgi:hypothetical protein
MEMDQSINLSEIVEKHGKWLRNEEGRERWSCAIGEDLSDANLSRADLSHADLSRANLSGANLSRAKNLLNPIKWMSENFEHDDLGFIVYKGIGDTSYNIPDCWAVEPGSFLEEVVNPLPVNDCGCGVNFAPVSWIR